MTSPYRLLGIVLVIVGVLLAPISYFLIDSVPLTAIGLSAMILGFISILLANTGPNISPEAYQILLKTAEENTTAMLEGLGINNKAVYLPRNTQDGHARALIPLNGVGDDDKLREKQFGSSLVKYGPKSEEMAIAVTTPGTLCLDLLKSKPGPAEDEIEDAMIYVMVGVLNIASGVKVHLIKSKVNVEVSGAKLGYHETPYCQSLGSPTASIAAAIASEALGKPIRVKEESQNKGKNRIILEILP